MVHLHCVQSEYVGLGQYAYAKRERERNGQRRNAYTHSSRICSCVQLYVSQSGSHLCSQCHSGGVSRAWCVVSRLLSGGGARGP